MLSWFFGSRNGGDSENYIEEKSEIEDMRRIIDTMKLMDNPAQNLDGFINTDVVVFDEARTSITSKRGLAVLMLLARLHFEVRSFDLSIQRFCIAVLSKPGHSKLDRRRQMDQYLNIDSTEDTCERWERLRDLACEMAKETIPKLQEELNSNKEQLLIALNKAIKWSTECAYTAKEFAEQCDNYIELRTEYSQIVLEKTQQGEKLYTQSLEAKELKDAHTRTLRDLTASVKKHCDLESKLKAAQKEAAEKLKAAEERTRIEVQRLRKEFDDGPIDNPRYLRFKYTQLLRDHNAEVRKGENLGRVIEKLKADNEAFLMKVTTGQAEVDSAAADNKELVRLRGDVKAMHNLKVECDRLKELLRDSHVKEVEDQLRRSRAEVNELRVILKEKSAPQLKSAKPSGIAGTEGSTTIESGTGTTAEKSFPKASARTLRALRSTLIQLSQQVIAMSDDQVGMGWGIVERAESLIKASSVAMINEIDRCLALRGEAGRLQDLDQTGFPALKASLDTIASAAPAGGEGVSRFLVLAENDGKNGSSNVAATQTPKVLKVVVNPSSASSSKFNRQKSKA